MRNAYYHAGMAVEFALKARIMHTEGLNSWPTSKTRPELYTHNLGDLLQVANLKPALEQEVADLSPLGIAWYSMKDFNINLRYPNGRPFPRRRAVDAVRSITEMGLVEWLIRGIL